MLALLAAVDGIIPAYAGSTAECSGMSGQATDHPRIRGEHHTGSGPWLSRSGSSPHTRGALDPGHYVYQDRIIPAYAGSTRSTGAGQSAEMDHPRIRGEHRLTRPGVLAEHGSSPHTRGALHADAERGEGLRIIPAYAGSTRRRRSGTRRVGDHPRIRGEHHLFSFR